MDALDRFAAMVGHDVAVDEAAITFAAHLDRSVDIDRERRRLDELGRRVGEPTLDGVRRLLFDDLAFVGDRQDYYDPANSLLPSVLDRRRGIPISLSVLVMGVARRVSVPVDGVAMPGHFLLRDRVDPAVFVDPFHGGAVLDEAGCEERLREIQGPDARLDPAWLDPVPATVILVRMLTNLRLIHRRTGDRAALSAVLELLSALPHGEDVVRERADLLVSQGRFDLAADLHEQLDDESKARALRARLN